MQVSVKWLHYYIDFTETAEELADKLTMAGIPVENVIRADEGLDKVVTGRIEKIEVHPDSDHMVITSMNVGAAEPVQIVTGAQNVREGQIVPVAMIGAKLFMKGVWKRPGVWNVEEFDPDPFMDELNKQGLPWHEVFDGVLEL